jgi:dTDP-4-amino-4,6-dideoxygalactose transaminase
MDRAATRGVMMAKLAIKGGTPVRTKPFPRWPEFGEEEKNALTLVLQGRSWGGYPSPNTYAKILNEQFAAFQGVRYGVACANGTVSLEVALKAGGLRPGDEVIVPAYTWVGTAAAVLFAQGIPVFVDSDPANYCMDPKAFEAAITPRTSAVIPVHLGMEMADMDAILPVARRSQLLVIEDCAHAHGAQWKGLGAGSLGAFGSFSMQSSKLLTAGEGGMILTSNEELEERCQTLINCGRPSPTDRYKYRRIGHNYRITEFQAALLLVQLGRLPEQTERRLKNARLLARDLEGIRGIRPLSWDARITRPAIYHYLLRYDLQGFGGIHRDVFLRSLRAEGIPAEGAFYEPVYRAPLWYLRGEDFAVFADSQIDYSKVRCPVAEKAAYEESVWLHHALLLGEASDVRDIVEAIMKIQTHAAELADVPRREPEDSSDL